MAPENKVHVVWLHGYFLVSKEVGKLAQLSVVFSLLQMQISLPHPKIGPYPDLLYNALALSLHLNFSFMFKEKMKVLFLKSVEKFSID